MYNPYVVSFFFIFLFYLLHNPGKVRLAVKANGFMKHPFGETSLN